MSFNTQAVGSAIRDESRALTRIESGERDLVGGFSEPLVKRVAGPAAFLCAHLTVGGRRVLRSAIVAVLFLPDGRAPKGLTALARKPRKRKPANRTYRISIIATRFNSGGLQFSKAALSRKDATRFVRIFNTLMATEGIAETACVDERIEVDVEDVCSLFGMDRSCYFDSVASELDRRQSNMKLLIAEGGAA